MPMGESAPAIASILPSPTVDSVTVTPADGHLNLHLHGLHTSRPPSSAASLEPAGPADLDRQPVLWERVAWYGGIFLLASLLAVAGYRLDQIDIRAPFYYDLDSLLILPYVKATVERGSHWQNERLGYPGVQQLYDFPVIDHLHFALIWVLGQFIPNAAVVYNVYYLLTYPLAALTAMVVFRQLRLTLPAAAVGGLLYAFLPYHHLRWEQHFFLSAYWMVPLACLPALEICKGKFPFFRREGPAGVPRLRLFRWHTLWMVLLGAATASAGAYYAFFACALIAAAGAYGWAVLRTYKAAVSAAGLVAVIAAFGILNHLPTFVYVAEHGRNSAAERYAAEADIYGMKIAHLVLPVDGHNLTALGRLKSSYNSSIRPLENENATATLGVIGAVGLVVLVGALLLPTKKGWPYGPLSSLTGFILLLSVVGGFGGVFNLIAFDQIRCYNRFVVYLALICLLAVLWPVDRFLLSRTGWARWLRYPAFAALLVLGISDQTPTAWFSSDLQTEYINKQADRFWADQRFFGEIEETMPAGSKVFTLPYIPYPEVPPLHNMNTYEHVRGYLHTRTLVWSYGAMKNREVDTWQRDVAREAPEQFLTRIVYRGFDGVFVDKRGYMVTEAKDGPKTAYTTNEGNKVVNRLKRAAEANGQVKIREIVHKDGEQVFLDLRPYRDWLWNLDGGKTFEKGAAEEREQVLITWLQGFNTFEPYGLEDKARWASRSALAVIVNPSDRTRTVRFSTTFGPDTKGVFRIRIDGGNLVQTLPSGERKPWADDFTVEKKEDDWSPPKRNYGVPKEYVLEIPPGRHRVQFHCVPPDKFMPGDVRPLCYYLRNVKFVEVK